MQARWLTLALCVAFATIGYDPPEAAAQFNPEGRQKKPPQRPRTTTTRRPAARPAVKKPPSDDALISRYSGIVMQQPGAQFPLQRLAELYRKRDGNLDKLVSEFEARAKKSGPDQWNALVALAGIYKQNGDLQRAIQTYETAIAEKPGNPIALTALAHLHLDRGNKADAKARFEQALPKLTGADLEQTLRTLMGLALDLKDWAAATSYHARLVKLAKGSFFVRAELGRELMVRGEYQRAVQEYERVVKAATGDNRVMAPALRDLGRAYANLGKREQALKHLRRALTLAGAQAGVRSEIYDIIVDVYRKDEKLRELISELESQRVNDFERLRMLGSLYEETGRVKKALDTYKRALQKKPKDIGTRIKVVQLLQIQGELSQAIKEYEALIRAAPRNPDFVFQLAEALIQQGNRARALAELKKLEARSLGDEETLAALADFYERVEESGRAMTVLKRLTEVGSGDPRHLVELGDRYWQEGNKDRAKQTWLRVKTVVPDRARALFTLGEVYLEHEMPDEGLAALREAVKLKPNVQSYRKAYALALERTGASQQSQDTRFKQYDEARTIWEALLKDAGDDHHLAREARQHIVTLWALGGQLDQRERPLSIRFKAKPPDLEGGRLLAEVQFRQRRYARAEQTLERLIKLAPGDVVSMLRLEQVLVQQRKMKRAIEVLQKLTEADPKRAREYYQRMAKYAAELYEDDKAVAYAARAVELSPDDAEGHKKLGEMYRRRQQIDRAIHSFRNALQKNSRLFTVHFQLAELLISQGKTEEADQLLRRVIRAAPDEELVGQAARLSMQINLGRGTLESLEKELLPVALGNPQRPLYRRLLVEVYGALAFPLVQQAASGDAEQAEKARAELQRIGDRAVKPLLDALNDDREAQQRTAIELLSHIQNKGAGPALFAYATGNADMEMRVRAMLAVGSLRDPALLAKFRDLLVADGAVRGNESDPVAVAAAWAVARVGDERARGLLLRLLDSEAPSIRALGALGLGFIHARASGKHLVAVARATDVGPEPRAAAAMALGELGYRDAVDTLAELAESSNSLIRAQAMIALARLQAKTAPGAVGEGLVSSDPALRRAAAAAALVLSTGAYRLSDDPFARVGARVQVDRLLERLLPSGYSAAEHAAALVKLQEPLAAACVAAAQSSPERAQAVLESLLARGGKPAFGELTERLDELTERERKPAEAAAERIMQTVVPAFVALAQHPTPSVRVQSVRLLAYRSEPEARRAVIDNLRDKDPSVQRAALEAVTRARTPGAVVAIRQLLSTRYPWPVRAQAARALGRITRPEEERQVLEALAESAQKDEYSLVREACLVALTQLDQAAARSVLARARTEDPEPRLRELAEKLISDSKP